jgi:hypothetical protein
VTAAATDRRHTTPAGPHPADEPGTLVTDPTATTDRTQEPT